MFTKLHSFPAEFGEEIFAFAEKVSGNFIIVAHLLDVIGSLRPLKKCSNYP